MAATLQLSWSSTTLNLHAGEDAGWRVSDWRPACAKDGEEWVWEEMIADVDEESDDALATSVRAMEAMQRYAQKYRSDILETTPVWLTCQMAGETNARRACVREIQMLPQSDEFGPGLADDHRIRFRLRIERRAWWEATRPTPTATSLSVSGLGGVMDYTASPASDVAGTVAARVYKIHMDTSVMGSIQKAWIGFHDMRKPYSSFIAECESLTLGTDATATADASASPGTGNSRVTVSFATAADWAARVSNFSMPLYGTALVLCRAYVASGTVAELQLRWNGIYGPVVRVSATTWTLHEMGMMKRPTYGRLGAEAISTVTDFVRLSLYARRISGSGSLYVDLLGFVPSDDLLIYVDGNGNDILYAGYDETFLNETPDGLRSGLTVDVSSTDVITNYAETRWSGPGVPVGDGRLVLFLAHAAGASTLTDTASIYVQVVPRWRMLRGSN